VALDFLRETTVLPPPVAGSQKWAFPNLSISIAKWEIKLSTVLGNYFVSGTRLGLPVDHEISNKIMGNAVVDTPNATLETL
jgi:hypothetical protein